MNPVLDIEAKCSLLIEFKELNTLKAKLDFWNKRLPVNFVKYNELDDDVSDLFNVLREFNIEVKEEEREEFAKWVLDNYHSLSKASNKLERLLVFELLVKSFNVKLEEQENKIELISEELWDLKSSFKQRSGRSRGGIFQLGGESEIRNIKYNANFESFEAFKELGIKPNYKNIHPSIFTILQIENGYTLGRYWKYLEDLKEQYSKNEKVELLTIDQRLLILHYLGALKTIQKQENATKKGTFLNKLFGTNEDKFRQRFSSINELVEIKPNTKNSALRKNLEKVKELFEELGLETLAKKVTDDLRNVR
jgi:hypothetical protein